MVICDQCGGKVGKGWAIALVHSDRDRAFDACRACVDVGLESLVARGLRWVVQTEKACDVKVSGRAAKPAAD